MAEQADKTLTDQLRDLQVPRGQVAIWALGQQGYILKGGATTIIIDPYLTNTIETDMGGEHRQVDIAIAPDQLDMIDAAFVTHAHPDHLDAPTLAPLLAAAPQAKIWTSYAARDTLLKIGTDSARVNVPPIDKRQVINDDLAMTAIPSAHYTQEPDATGAPAFLGFIIELNGLTFYHAGDTVLYEGLPDRLKKANIDVAFLPINGRDWFREQNNIVGNLDYREAVELAAYANIRVIIPGHNNLFAGNHVNPAYFVDYLNTAHPKQRYHFLQAGELYYYVR